MYAGRPNTISRRTARGQPSIPAAVSACDGSTCAVCRSRGARPLKRSTSVSCGKPTYIITMPEANHMTKHRQVAIPT